MQNTCKYECCIAHDCRSTDITECAHCLIGLGHLVVNPVELACGHLACIRCTKRRPTAKCKYDGSTDVLNEIKVPLSELSKFNDDFLLKLDESSLKLLELIKCLIRYKIKKRKILYIFLNFSDKSCKNLSNKG